MLTEFDIFLGLSSGKYEFLIIKILCPLYPLSGQYFFVNIDSNWKIVHDGF